MINPTPSFTERTRFGEPINEGDHVLYCLTYNGSQLYTGEVKHVQRGIVTLWDEKEHREITLSPNHTFKRILPEGCTITA